jgi:putative transposase
LRRANSYAVLCTSDTGKFPGLFDAIVADTGIQVVLTGVRMPGMNARMEW